MPGKSRLEKWRRFSSFTLIGIFVVLLWLPAFDSFFHWDNTSKVNENRALATRPEWNSQFSGIHPYISDLEKYYNDHFGFRKKLIYWGQKSKRKWFRDSPLWSVRIGRKGWLYLAESRKVQDKLKAGVFNDRWLHEWKTLLEHRRNWLARRGIQYIFVVPPGKSTAYPEYLPESLHNPTAAKLESFFAYMKTNSTVQVLDLRPALNQAKKFRQTYFFTDTHWNDYGAFIGYQELMRSLCQNDPALTPLPETAFEIKISKGIGGNLAVMLADAEAMPENHQVAFIPLPPLQPLVSTTNDARTQIVTTRNPKGNGKAVVYHDSFALPWFQFLGQHFNQVVCFYKQHTFDADYLEKEKPQIVIDEIVEDLFLEQIPSDLMREDNLN